MIKKVTVEKWITTDGQAFDAKDAAEAHETAYLIETCLERALGNARALESWGDVSRALLVSPSFIITRVGTAV